MKLVDLFEDKKNFLTGYKLALHAWEKINADCKPFLEQSKGIPMFRGVAPKYVGGERAEYATFEKRSVRTDRIPRSSAHDAFFNWSFNAVMEREFKIKNIRYSSLFATGSEAQAVYYGDLHFIFPIGNFDTIWSKRVNDSYEEINLLNHMRHEFENRAAYAEWVDENLEPYFERLVKEGNFDYTVLKTARNEHINKMYVWLDKTLIKEYGYVKNAALDYVLKSGNEIFIPAPCEYYSVSARYLAEAVGTGANEEGTYIYKEFFRHMQEYKAPR
jgi:hypothetical protein